MSGTFEKTTQDRADVIRKNLMERLHIVEEGEDSSAVEPFMGMGQFYSTLMFSAHVPDFPPPPPTPPTSPLPKEMSSQPAVSPFIDVAAADADDSDPSDNEAFDARSSDDEVIDHAAVSRRGPEHMMAHRAEDEARERRLEDALMGVVGGDRRTLDMPDSFDDMDVDAASNDEDRAVAAANLLREKANVRGDYVSSDNDDDDESSDDDNDDDYHGDSDSSDIDGGVDAGETYAEVSDIDRGNKITATAVAALTQINATAAVNPCTTAPCASDILAFVTAYYLDGVGSCAKKGESTLPRELLTDIDRMLGDNMLRFRPTTDLNTDLLREDPGLRDKRLLRRLIVTHAPSQYPLRLTGNLTSAVHCKCTVTGQDIVPGEPIVMCTLYVKGCNVAYYLPIKLRAILGPVGPRDPVPPPPPTPPPTPTPAPVDDDPMDVESSPPVLPEEEEEEGEGDKEGIEEEGDKEGIEEEEEELEEEEEEEEELEEEAEVEERVLVVAIRDTDALAWWLHQLDESNTLGSRSPTVRGKARPYFDHDGQLDSDNHPWAAATFQHLVHDLFETTTEARAIDSASEKQLYVDDDIVLVVGRDAPSDKVATISSAPHLNLGLIRETLLAPAEVAVTDSRRNLTRLISLYGIASSKELFRKNASAKLNFYARAIDLLLDNL